MGVKFHTVFTICTLTFCSVPLTLSDFDVIVLPIPFKLNPCILSPMKCRPKHKYKHQHVKLIHHTEGRGNHYKEESSEHSYESKSNISTYDSMYADDRIVGGADVDINMYPYHVAYGNNCGGAIIDKKWVITAGHCRNAIGTRPFIRAGSKFLTLGKKVEVKNSYVHPQWAAKDKEHQFDYDFQLLELAKSLKFNENIQPVLVGRIEDMVIGKIITVTGWGNTRENGPFSSTLRAVRVPIISKENCQHVPFPFFRGSLTPRMFCAGYPEGKKDACQGDSGGPAVAYDRLLGVVSFGYGCAAPGAYGVYSKVPLVRAWIEEVTGLKLR